MNYVKFISEKFPEFNGANWLIRIPLAIVFIQQGFDKIPLDPSIAELYGLPNVVWFLVIICEIIAGFGLLFGGIMNFSGLIFSIGDLLTRFSGLIIVTVVSGVLVISQPESLLEILLNDQFHLLLYCGGLFFLLRGNRVK